MTLKSWNELPAMVRRSDRRLYLYVRSELEGDTDTLTVTVSDGADPIVGASVTIGSTTETTGDDGKASFELEYGDYTATISKEGYVTATETLAFRSNHKNFTVSLTGDTPVTPEYSLEAYSSGTLIGLGCLEGTGETANNRAEYELTYFTEPSGIGMKIWASTSAVVDGTTLNNFYESSSSEQAILEGTLVSGVGSATITCVDSEDTPLEGAEVSLGLLPNKPIFTDTTDSSGVVEFEIMPLVTYPVFLATSSDDSLQYSGSLTVDGDETVTITLTALQSAEENGE